MKKREREERNPISHLWQQLYFPCHSHQLFNRFGSLTSLTTHSLIGWCYTIESMKLSGRKLSSETSVRDQFFDNRHRRPWFSISDQRERAKLLRFPFKNGDVFYNHRDKTLAFSFHMHLSLPSAKDYSNWNEWSWKLIWAMHVVVPEVRSTM